jgi:site-specific DNA recombinase
MAGAAARKETEQMSKRLRRAFDQKAAAGLPHGAAPYGWRREKESDRSGAVVESHDLLDEAQAQVIRDAVTMLRGGTSLRATANALNERGLFSPRLSHKDADGERHPLPWASTTLKQVLLRARNAGLRTHRGMVLDGVTGEWPPIFDVDTYHWLVATLNDPRRQTNRGSTRKHLLTGIAICGRCGSSRMAVNVGRVGANGKHQPPAYACQACTRVRRKQSEVDAVVEEVLIAILEKPGALDHLVTGNPDEVARAHKMKAAAEANMEFAADQFGHHRWTAAQVDRVNAIAIPEIESAEAVIAANQPAALPVHLAGPNAEANWHEIASLDEKRTLIRALITVKIMPSGPGRSFERSLIKIQPLQGEIS